MKLKKLTIHNIASIADAVIDFEREPLSEAPLFIITGDTGAGKSTLLDAICLALYKATPRLEGRSSDKVGGCGVRDPKQLLRRGTAEGYSRLEFEDANGLVYTAQWSLRRARLKVDGTLQPAEHTLQCHDGSDLVTKDTVKSIEALLGMNYNQFSHTALLAQDAFARFLTSDSTEKAELLAQLTGTEYYAEIGKRIYLRTKEKEAAIKEKRAAIEAIQLMPDEAVEETRKRLEEINRLYASEEETLKKVQAQVQWMEQRARLAAQVEAQQLRRQQAQQVLEREDYLQRRQCIELWDKTVELRHQLGLVRDNRQKLSACEQERERLRATFDTLASQTPQPIDLQQAEQSLAEAQAKVEQLKRQAEQYDMVLISKEIEACNKHLSDMAQSQALLQEKSQAERQRKELEPKALEAAAAWQAAKTHKERAEAAMQAARSIREKVIVNLRNELKKGDICPLCGQTVAHDHGAGQLLDEAYRQAKADHDAALRRHDEALERHQGLKAQTEMLDRRINELAAKPLVDCGAEAQAQARQRLEQQQQRQAQAQAAGRQLAEAQEQLATALRHKEQAARIATLRERLRETALVHQWPIAPSRAASAAASLEGQLNALALSVNSNKNSLSIYATHLRQAQARVEEEVRRQGVPAEEAERLMALTDSQIATLRQWVAQQQKALDEASAALAAVEEQQRQHLAQAPRLPEGATPEQMKSELAEKQLAFNALNQQKGSLEATLRQDAQLRRQRLGLEQAIAEARQDCERWERLNALFGDATGAKFLNIAQSFVLEGLLQRANEYLAGISDRYMLHCQPGTLVVEVHDSRSSGAVGASTTLSGGERFMASLALALALANLSDQGLDTLFIDEGFGHLDDEHIRSAIATLTHLGSTLRRRIGIISHVPQIEEIPAPKIHVSPTGAGNSSRLTVEAR